MDEIEKGVEAGLRMAAATMATQMIIAALSNPQNDINMNQWWLNTYHTILKALKD